MSGQNVLWEQSCQYDTYGEVTASSRGQQIDITATNTKSAWAQLVASTAFNAEGIIVHLGGVVAGSPNFLVDIGIGASTAERVLVPDLHYSNRLGHPMSVWLPLRVPSGSRLAVRAAGQSTANEPAIAVTICSANPSGLPGFNKMTAYGTASGDSGGTSIDPGTTANTKGSWTQVVASTGDPIKALLCVFSSGGDAARADASWLVDVGMGASTAERIIIPDIYLGTQTASDVTTPWTVGPVAASIPASTRLAVRAQCSITTATSRLFDTALYGFS